MTTAEICNSIEPELLEFIHRVVLVIKIGVPLILIILCMIDFGKGVIASKEDEIKKGQQVFLKRIVAAVLVFLTFSIVQFAFNLVPGDNSQIFACAKKILNGDTVAITDDGNSTVVDDNADGINSNNAENNN